MQSLSIGELDAYFSQVLKTIPEARLEMFESLAEDLLKEVRTRIGGAGKVQSWQEKYVGSGGGYAAVRPKAKTFDRAELHDGTLGKAYAVGYVTNAITSGHKQKPGRFVPGLNRKLYKDRVAGKHFYAEAHGAAEQLARNAIEQFEQRIKEELE